MNDTDLTTCWCGHTELRHADHDCYDCPDDTARKLNHVMGWFTDDALRVRYAEALLQLEQARAELAATVRAKQENDERFMIDRAEARTERDRLAAAIQRVRAEHEESGGTCSTCIDWDERPQRWPCATITALDGEVPDGN